ncbi:hypothetical protein ES703_102865 [subsurface metagenome]
MAIWHSVTLAIWHSSNVALCQRTLSQGGGVIPLPSPPPNIHEEDNHD